jgi:hypothetical protein
MFGKTRTFAVAVAAAGLVGSWAPLASAATTSVPGGDSGGLVNVSRNLIPVQACNNTVPVNVIGIQVPLNSLAATLGLGSAGDNSSHTDTSCHLGAEQSDSNKWEVGQAPITSWPAGGCDTCMAPGDATADMGAPADMGAADDTASDDTAATAPDAATAADDAATTAGDAVAAPMDATDGPADWPDTWVRSRTTQDSGGLLNVSNNEIPVQVCGNTVPVNVIGGQAVVQNVAADLGIGDFGNSQSSTDSSCHLGTAQNN